MYNFSQYVSKLILCVNGLLVQCVSMLQPLFCVLAQSVERPPHNREVVGSISGSVIPKDVKRWELLLPCLAFNIWKG